MRRGLALLVAPPGRIADATLVVIDGGGHQHRIALPGITAGLVPPPGNGRSDIARERTPGLAVRGGAAFIASATDARVVRVDLASGRSNSHAYSDARAAKGVEGAERELGFVGAHTLATRPRHRTWVIDLRTGRVIRSLATAQPGAVLGSE